MGKKSKRRCGNNKPRTNDDRQEQQQQARSTLMGLLEKYMSWKLPCRHGLCLDNDRKVAQWLAIVATGFRFAKDWPATNARALVVRHWLGEKHRLALVDEDLLGMIIVLLTEETIQGKPVMGHPELASALYLFVSQIVYGKRSCYVLWELPTALSSSHWQTEGSLLHWLNKKIPCNCLKVMRQRMKSEAKSTRCEFCRKIKLRSKIYPCGGCQTAMYCSKDCQKNDWVFHKPYCRTMSTKLAEVSVAEKRDRTIFRPLFGTDYTDKQLLEKAKEEVEIFMSICQPTKQVSARCRN